VNTILKLLRFIGGYQSTTPSLQDPDVVARLEFCADTTYDDSNPSASSIDVNDLLLHLRVLGGYRGPRRSLT
jgi:hypothetical protein